LGRHQAAAITAAPIPRLAGLGRFRFPEALAIALANFGAAAPEQGQDLGQQLVLRIAIAFSALDLVHTDSIVAMKKGNHWAVRIL
jgi:hypothetical protein